MPDRKLLEHSAGGVILEDGKALLILMQNLSGDKVWTFPKGHLDAGETPQEAALREVSEETGYDCEIISYLCTAAYSFRRNGSGVEKDVRWYLMRRVGGDGVIKTPAEIHDLRWVPLDEAEKLLAYPSDLKMLALLKERRRIPE